MKRLLVHVSLLLAFFCYIAIGGCKKNDEPSAAVLTTAGVDSITQSTAVSGGNITSDGGVTITARGVCWSTAATPSISDNITSDGAGAGTYTSRMTGLIAITITVPAMSGIFILTRAFRCGVSKINP